MNFLETDSHFQNQWYSEITEKVPDYTGYLSYEELEENSQQLSRDYPSTVRLLNAGKSEEGRPINALKIGNGRHNILIYGFPNPEEPLGGLVIDYLSEVLASNEKLLREMDCTWHFIKCIDPDGAKLTEGYLKGPLTPDNFAKNFYRTPNYLTGEMNFPFSYGEILDLNTPTKETLALIKIMNSMEFSFISSLHVMKFGEMTFAVSGPCPKIYSQLQHTAKENNIPLRKRFGDIVAPGIQLARYMTPAANYVRMTMQGLSPLQKVTGAFSFEYARMINPRLFMMIPECTTWYDPRCYDDPPSGSKLRETMDYVGGAFGKAARLVRDSYKEALPYLDPNSPFARMLGEVVEGMEHPVIGVVDPDPTIAKEELDLETTLSQKISTEARADIYRLFNVGASIRMIDWESERNHKGELKLRLIREKLQTEFDQYSSELDAKYDIRHYPLKNLVAMNLASLLVSIQYCKGISQPPEIFLN